jgi:phytoene synthase
VSDRRRSHDDAEAVIRSGSASFALASRFFDRDTRRRVWSLYAWCRHCDDVTDGQVLGSAAGESRRQGGDVDALRRESLRAIAGDRSAPEPFAGLARVVNETAMPLEYIADHLEAFAMDAEGRQCATFDDTLRYCYHAAGTVGLMMAWIMGIRDRQTLLRGCDLGLAFQLTNIARDVGDDALNHRVYLPLAWLREAGVIIDRGRPLDQSTRDGLIAVVSQLLDEADRYYASAWEGIGRLPARSAWAVATARHVYADIGLEVRRRGARAWDRRVATSSSRKLLRVAQALGETAWTRASRRWSGAPSRDGLWTPPLPGAQG